MRKIEQYEFRHESALINMLALEPEWNAFINVSAIGDFKKALVQSETLVCEIHGEVCGYLRAINDAFGVYVSELYVAPGFRCQGHGRALLDTLREHFPGKKVYVLSDEDLYYEKLGLERAGSVFLLS